MGTALLIGLGIMMVGMIFDDNEYTSLSEEQEEINNKRRRDAEFDSNLLSTDRMRNEIKREYGSIYSDTELDNMSRSTIQDKYTNIKSR